MAYSRFGTDREERINYDRMRKYGLKRAKNEMERAGLGLLSPLTPIPSGT